ncbi:3-hydroxybutyrate dehydrogenase [Membranihabitans maritimus]|uniref:3-hydroxybutyrate dehydrogenase n=1 Tax=Membranihabitans maritimus TaxID=2904244 RepID=UPI001F22AEBD|nr:3-hydroxybutyrate dehydrogenase [Membranihabitans maritimus]
MDWKVVFITGAANGIGLDMVRGFCKSGYKVKMIDINQDLLIQRERELKEKGFHVSIDFCDVTDEHSVKEKIESTIDKYGKIDVLVNNAGIQHVALIEDFSTQKFKQLLDVMVTGAFITTKHVFPGMKKNNFGRIINMSSINGLIGFAGKSAYNSAKHGLIGLTKVAALEGANFGITANAICPGYIDTDMVRGQLEDLAKTRNISLHQVLEQIIYPLVPQKRLIPVSEVTQLALYLASEKTSSITGQSMVIDGGYTVQ